MTYEISYTDGRRAESHDTFSEAMAAVESVYSEWYAADESGWEVDGAVYPVGSARVLVWADESESEDDDGAHAVASIKEVCGEVE